MIKRKHQLLGSIFLFKTGSKKNPTNFPKIKQSEREKLGFSMINSNLGYNTSIRVRHLKFLGESCAGSSLVLCTKVNIDDKKFTKIEDSKK